MPKKSTKPRAGASVKFLFDDGEEMSLSAEEVELQLLMQFAAMSASTSPELRLAGRNNLAEIAAQSARSRVSSVKQSARAKGPRSLTAVQEARLLRRYEERVAAGRKYGAQKELSAEFGVSLATVKNIIGRRSG